LIDEVVEPFAAQLNARPRGILVPDKEIPVFGDNHLIVTALRQLVDNAIKYSDPGTAITISAEAAGVPGKREILIAVHNEGPAIRAEDRERIFDRFYRSPGTEHRAAGTGLGLSITKKIAEAHQGRVWVGDAGEAKGATFFFALPFDPTQTAGVARKVVEDDPDV
jgi:two-component system sensor histidine kinase KdpD